MQNEIQNNIDTESFRVTPLTIFVLLLLGIAWPLMAFYFLDSQMTLAENVSNPMSEIYFPTILIQLITLFIVLLAVRFERTSLADIGFKNFNRWTFLQALLFFIGANIFLYILQQIISSNAPSSFAELEGLLPKTIPEKITWLTLSLVVAISEEVVFRGYLITRLSRIFKGRMWLGVLIASLSFASGHLYQGFGGFFLIFIYGLMFSFLFLKTGSLWPGIIAHFLQDSAVLVLPVY